MATGLIPSNGKFPSATMPNLVDLEKLPFRGAANLGIYEFCRQSSGLLVPDARGIYAPMTITAPSTGPVWVPGGLSCEGTTTEVIAPFSGMLNLTWMLVFKGDTTQVAAQGAVISTAGAYTFGGDNVLWQKTNDQVYRQRVYETIGNQSASLPAPTTPGKWWAVLAYSNGPKFGIINLITGESDDKAPETFAGSNVAATPIPGTNVCKLARNSTTQGPGVSRFKGILGYAVPWSIGDLSKLVTKARIPSEIQKCRTWLHDNFEVPTGITLG